MGILTHLRYPLACLLVTYVLAKGPSSTWKLMASNKRCVKTLNTLTTLTTRKISCATACSGASNCWSFNFLGGKNTCELVNGAPCHDKDPDLVTSPSWKYYKFDPPKKENLNGSALCPSNAVLVRYEQPYMLKPYDPTLAGYVCTKNTWVLNEHANGRRECVMVWVPYYDRIEINAVSYQSQLVTYDVALSNCYAHNCLGVSCIGSLCWLKTDSYYTLNIPLLSGGSPNAYWYTKCE